MKLKEKLNGYKKVKICGFKFTIRKINPLLDFELENMPQIFTSYQSRRKIAEDKIILAEQKKILNQMMTVVEKGVVYPELVPREKKKEGLTVEDLFLNDEIGIGLFKEIMFHSLNKFRGLKRLFFSAKIKLSYYINFVRNMVNYRRKLLGKV